jgi:hypothetical protein
MATSKLQRRMSDLLSTHFGGNTVRENLRPQWLIGPKGERLELDFFIEELAIAIEVQGQQHYSYTPLFHSSYEDFQNRQILDQAKRDTCKKLDVILIEVFDEQSALSAIETIYRYADLSVPEETPVEILPKGKEDNSYDFYTAPIIPKRVKKLARLTTRLKKLCRRHNQDGPSRSRWNELFMCAQGIELGLAKWDKDALLRHSERRALAAAMIALADAEPIITQGRPDKIQRLSKSLLATGKDRIGNIILIGSHKQRSHARKLQIERLDLWTYRVFGGEKEHVVRTDGERIICDCESSWQEGTTICSHIIRYHLFREEIS